MQEQRNAQFVAVTQEITRLCQEIQTTEPQSGHNQSGHDPSGHDQESRKELFAQLEAFSHRYLDMIEGNFPTDT